MASDRAQARCGLSPTFAQVNGVMISSMCGAGCQAESRGQTTVRALVPRASHFATCFLKSVFPARSSQQGSKLRKPALGGREEATPATIALSWGKEPPVGDKQSMPLPREASCLELPKVCLTAFHSLQSRTTNLRDDSRGRALPSPPDNLKPARKIPQKKSEIGRPS